MDYGLFQGEMSLKILLCAYLAGDHGSRLRPVFFNQKGKVNMAHQVGDQGGGEKTVTKAAIKYKISAEAQKG